MTDAQTMRNVLLFVSFLLIISAARAQQNASSRAITLCLKDSDCGQGVCNTNDTIGLCICNRGWTYARDGSNQCTYERKLKLTAFLLSFFVGGFGADWFYLSVGNAGYIVAGVFKLLTLGGLGIWWLVDWIRILTNVFNDGQGASLMDWNS